VDGRRDPTVPESRAIMGVDAARERNAAKLPRGASAIKFSWKCGLNSTDRIRPVSNRSYPDEDRELVARCQEGDSIAFEELVRKYQQTVMNLAYHYIGNRNEVEDAAQKIFMKVYFSLPKFDNRRPFFPWLYRIAINQCYDELRKVRRKMTHTFSELSLEDAASVERLISHGEAPAHSDENRQELHTLLRKMLDQLPAPQRLAIVLRDLEVIPYAQLALVLKCSEQTARLKVFRARLRLKTLMEKALQKQNRLPRGK
jgi:RNA polymerase sigma-70 factor (ECF subfamily)